VADLLNESGIKQLLDFFTDEILLLGGLLLGFCCTSLESG
jgi:hypothetical protein